MNASPRFNRHETPRAVLLVDPEFEAPLLAMKPLDYSTLGAFEGEQASEPGPSGRGPTAILTLDSASPRILVRTLRHGGFLGGWLGTRQLGVGRPIAELDVSLRLREAGVLVARPLFVLGYRRGALWEIAFASAFVERSQNGEEFLRQQQTQTRIEAAARAAARTVRALHDAGGRHADLNIRNVLFAIDDDNPPETLSAILIDLDRATIAAPVEPARRMHELMRLLRSLRKHRLLEAIGIRGIASFFSTYVGNDRVLRSQLLATRGREELRLALHSLGYRA